MKRKWSWRIALTISSAFAFTVAPSFADEASDYSTNNSQDEFRLWDGLDVQHDLASYKGAPDSAGHDHHHDHGTTSCDSRGFSKACQVSSRCGNSWLWTMEAEGVFLRPNLTDNPIAFTLSDLNPASSQTLTSGGADIEDMTLAPRITFGIRQESGWGLRARAFRLDASQNGFNPVTGIGDIGGTSFNRLNLYYMDLEMTRDACFGSWNVLTALGVRHAAIERAESLAAAGVVDLGGGFSDVIGANGLSSRSFHGTGLTAALQGTKKARCRGFSWYWNLRGSVLWGDNDTFSSTSAILSGAGGSASSFDQALNIDSDTLFIGEAQLGLEWSRELACMPGRAFARLGVEAQYWEANEGSSFSTSAVSTVGESLGVIVASQRELEIDMYGLVLGTGLEW